MIADWLLAFVAFSLLAGSRRADTATLCNVFAVPQIQSHGSETFPEARQVRPLNLAVPEDRQVRRHRERLQGEVPCHEHLYPGN